MLEEEDGNKKSLSADGVDEEDDDGEEDPDANSGIEYLPAPKGAAVGPYKKKKKLVSCNGCISH